MQKLALLGGVPVRTAEFTIEVPQIDQSDIDAVLHAMETRCLSIFSSPNIREFEADFARYVGTKHAIALTSGTAALQTALVSASIGPGDEVVVPVYTYAATINAALMQGAVPVFADVDSRSCGLDGSNIAAIEATVTPRTKAIVVVDLFGNPAPRRELQALATARDLVLIEDCAQSTGARIHDRPVGSFGIGCHSFGEIKNMTSAEGGMLTTDNDEFARRARLMRHAGEAWRATRTTTIGTGPSGLYDMIRGIDYEFVGANFRMNALQAALGRSQLRRLDQFNEERRLIGERYRAGLACIPGLELMRVHAEAEPVYNRFPIFLADGFPITRDAFLAALLHEGMPAGVYYPIPFNRTHVIRNRIGLGSSHCPFECKLATDINYEAVFPGAETVCETHVLLPCYPGLSIAEVDSVIEAIAKVREAVASPEIAQRVEKVAVNAHANYFGQFFRAANV